MKRHEHNVEYESVRTTYDQVGMIPEDVKVPATRQDEAFVIQRVVVRA